MGKNGTGPSTGKGADFKEERTTRAPRSLGAAASLDRYGSLADTIECVLAHGAFISFSRTSDGGATVIRILDNDKKLTTYCTTHSDLLEAFEAIKQKYPREVLTVRPKLE